MKFVVKLYAQLFALKSAFQISQGNDFFSFTVTKHQALLLFIGEKKVSKVNMKITNSFMQIAKDILIVSFYLRSCAY